jgi:hypothetical protein
MFAPILNWVMGRGSVLRKPEPVTSEGFLEEWGREILLADPGRLKILAEIEDLLIGLPKGERSDLVTQAALRFALFVVDLPASERDHDARPFGLLDHSLAVARAAVGELVRPGFRASEDPAENYREQPVWAYSGFVLGLLHDAGKVFDLRVVPKPGAQAWNPLEGPLASSLGRCGKRESGRESWHWIEGRGPNSHVENGKDLTQLILPPRVKLRLGSRLGHLMEVFRESYTAGRETWARDPAGRVVSVVRRWDHDLSTAAVAPTKDQKTRDKVGDPLATPRAGASSPGLTAPETSPQGDPAPRSPGHGTEPCLATATPQPYEASAVPSRNVAEPPVLPAPPAPPVVSNTLMKSPAVPHPAPVVPRSKIDIELEGDRLMNSIREAVKHAKVSRNGSRGPVFVGKEYLWFKYPEAFIDIMDHVGLRFTVPIGERILSTLLKRPEIVPQNPRDALVHGLLPPRGTEKETFVRFRAAGFLPDDELATLGLWQHEIKVVDSALSRSAGNSRSIAGRGGRF